LTNVQEVATADICSALFTFFITYILFEVPSNILLKRLRPSVFLSSVIAIWGCITIGMGCTQSFAGLVVCRLLIGFFEAGFFPGCIYLISMCEFICLPPASAPTATY